jgi:hypothetical protein
LGQDKSKKAQDKPPPTVRIGRIMTKNDDEEAETWSSKQSKQVRNPDASRAQPRRRRRLLPPLPQTGFLGTSRPKKESKPVTVEGKDFLGSAIS